jgi:osmotically-inducible protein OsmY
MSDEHPPRPGLVIGPTSDGPDVDLTGRPAVNASPRSDDQILEDVSARIAASSLAPLGLKISVHQRVVTMSGTVPDEPARHQAEQIADSVAGVHDVRSELRVAREDSAA